ncbi:sugar phosphate isomerase/epimerase [Sediminibacterium sp. C3]|uniref:sugar phosphate isomerase/epimerase family protein n=1 Tax=Sediminibacterium sp. C3 TaxID=1267211 RepID=UPI0004166EEE|nr:sugar phosphate isomerase/epimerase [Sediminibacterium sp. C3]
MKRSQFIQSVALGALSVGLGDVFAQSKKPKNFAMQLFSVRDAVAKDLEGTLRKLRSIGYNQLEIYGYNGTFFGKTPKEFKTILANTDMKVISSHHVSGYGMKMKGSLQDNWKQTVDDLAAIDAKYMGCSYLFPNERTNEIYTALPDLLNSCGEVTKGSGIQFIYHNHEFEFEKFGDTLAYDHLLNKTDANLVKMELDLYWIYKAGKDPLAYFDKYPGRFPLWHVKDMSTAGEITEVGNGTIDFAKIFAARKKAGLKHWFVEQDISKGDIFESLKSSHQFLSSQKYS